MNARFSEITYDLVRIEVSYISKKIFVQMFHSFYPISNKFHEIKVPP